MLFGSKAAPKKAAKKGVKKAVKTAAGEPNIIKKIFAMPLIGGAKGVELSDDYKL